MRSVLFFLFAVSGIQARSIRDKFCEVSIEYRKGDLKEPQPLILTDSEEPTFILPNDKKLLLVPSNTSISLVCLGRNNPLQSFGSKNSVKAVCLEGKQFLVDSKVYEFSIFKCKFLSKETVRKANSTCLEKYQMYEIGFVLKKRFLPLLEICRDDKSYRTYYVRSTVVKEIFGYQGYPRPYWKYGNFYPGYNMNAIYKIESQLKSIKMLLGSEKLANKYIKAGEQFLNRGHLSAKADFIYGVQQTSTFWHLNTAPQWSSFNGGNWMIVESNVRDFAISRQMDLVVYTGVHGVATLTDVDGIEQPLHLHVNETHKAFPVPRFYWKIIHDPISNNATAFIGLNEPYAKSITEDMYLCPDISKDVPLPWLTWNPTSIEKGISYVCTVGELRKAVSTVPYFAEAGLLL